MANDKREKSILLFLSVAVLVCSWPSAIARADELDDLKQQVAELQKKVAQAAELADLKEQIAELENRIIQLEARQKLREKSLTDKIDEVAKQKTEQISLPESLKWVEKVKISGDLRYRHDHQDEQDSSGRWKNGIDRDRIRARLMLEAIVNDEWDVAFRIASGSDKSPISTNQDLEDAFSKKDIWLDLAYFNWHPAAVEGLNVVGGKITNPFYRVGKNELIWDSDLSPEGIAGQISKPLSDADRLFFNGGGFWVDENAAGADTSLWGAQTYIKHGMGDSDYLLVGASFWDYGNLQGRGDLKSTWGSSDFFGNTSSGGLYVSDYDIFEAFGEYGFQCSGMPIAVFGSWVQNVVASTNEDTGWLLGAKLNKAKEPGSWEFSYDYRKLEADAIVGGFAESDFFESTTNSRGHKFGFTYQLAKNLQSGLTYYLVEDTSNSTLDLDSRRLLADLVLKF